MAKGESPSALAAALAGEAVHEQRAAQKPEELAVLVDWLRGRPSPAAVLEVGSYRGGTLWLWRRLWPWARIVSVDNMSLERCPGCEQRIAHRDCSNRRIATALGHWPAGRLLIADSQDPDTAERAATWLEQLAPVFVFIDGDHEAAAARRDYELYSPLASRGEGGAVVLHDAGGEAFPGVVELWRELERTEPGAFLIHEGREDWGGLGVVPR